jgi:DNA-binding NarL/FixJ family response regulator
MLRLEGFMEIQKLHHDGVSVSEIARQLNLDRKTVLVRSQIMMLMAEVPSASTTRVGTEAEEVEG